MGLFNHFPYTNFHDLNLDWAIDKIKELITQGETLYAQLEEWKEDTDTELAAWKTETMAALEQWEQSLTTSLESWKEGVDIDFESYEQQLSGMVDQAEQYKLAAGASAADAEAAAASIPEDYTTVTRKVTSLEALTVRDGVTDFTPSDYTSTGIAWTVNPDGSITAAGTSTGNNAVFNIYASDSELPSWVTLGKTYHVHYSSTNVRCLMYWYRGSSLSAAAVSTYSDTEFTVPDDNTITGMILRLRVDTSGTTVNETVRPMIHPADELTNAELTEEVATALAHEDVDQAIAALSTEIETKASNADLYEYNSVDILQKAYPAAASNTRYGITYTKDGNGGWTISGTSTATTFCNMLSATTTLPDYVIPGRTYYLDMGSGTVPVRIYFYTTGGNNYVDYAASASITMPNTLTGLAVRFQIASGKTYSETVHYTMITEAIRAENAEGGGGGTDIYNTYNITTSPVITTDTNGWLQPIDDDSTLEADATDMTGPIMSMLADTGYCHLAPGLFYVSGSIDMPAHSCLCGCGDATTIRLLQSTSTGYAIKMRQYCTVHDLCVSGSTSATTPTTEGTRDGIHFKAAVGDAPSVTTDHCMLSNVWIRGFSGSGLLCKDTSINYSKGLYAENVFITRCYKGINIDERSEFNKFTNVCSVYCFIACVNNGGNNTFSACTFHATGTGAIGFYVDGNKYNSAHGTVIGCTFCHIGGNEGSAITMKDVVATTGFIISGCQFFRNSIDISNSSGIVFTGCSFGQGVGNQGATVNIRGYLAGTDPGDHNGLVLFTGCMFQNDESMPPVFTLSNTPKVVLSGCYGGVSGNPISLTP